MNFRDSYLEYLRTGKERVDLQCLEISLSGIHQAVGYLSELKIDIEKLERALIDLEKTRKSTIGHLPNYIIDKQIGLEKAKFGLKLGTLILQEIMPPTEGTTNPDWRAEIELRSVHFRDFDTEAKSKKD